MAKKVVVLNGSPVAGGCSETLSDYLIRGVQENGNTAVKMNLSKMNLHPCSGCNGCKMGKGSPCVQKDDMAEIYQAIQEADVIVWASPLYWMQFTAQIKMVMDRLYALSPESIANKQVALLAAAASPAEVIGNTLLPYYQMCFGQSLGWKDAGSVLAGGVFGPGDVEKTPYTQQAYELGKSL